MSICMYVCMYVHLHSILVTMYVRVYVCMYVCTYAQQISKTSPKQIQRIGTLFLASPCHSHSASSSLSLHTPILSLWTAQAKQHKRDNNSTLFLASSSFPHHFSLSLHTHTLSFSTNKQNNTKETTTAHDRTLFLASSSLSHHSSSCNSSCPSAPTRTATDMNDRHARS
jgi:hypothetical protein